MARKSYYEDGDVIDEGSDDDADRFDKHGREVSDHDAANAMHSGHSKSNPARPGWHSAYPAPGANGPATTGTL